MDLIQILMDQLADFEINENETLEDRVIEDQVDVKVVAIKGNSLLTGDERKPFVQFQQKRLQVIDQRLLQLRLHELR